LFNSFLFHFFFILFFCRHRARRYCSGGCLSILFCSIDFILFYFILFTFVFFYSFFFFAGALPGTPVRVGGSSFFLYSFYFVFIYVYSPLFILFFSLQAPCQALLFVWVFSHGGKHKMIGAAKSALDFLTPLPVVDTCASKVCVCGWVCVSE